MKHIYSVPYMTKAESFKDLQSIPGVGKSIAEDLYNIGIRSVTEFKERDPEALYETFSHYVGIKQNPRFAAQSILQAHFPLIQKNQVVVLER